MYGEAPKWLIDDARKEEQQFRRLDAQRRRDGILGHVIDPSDPWSGVEWRVCAPGCWQHRRAS